MNRDIQLLRETVVKLTQLLAGKGLVVTQRGTRAYVETNKHTLKPTRINIPHIPDNASEQLILAIQGFIDHEVAHVLFTDWNTVNEACAQSSSLGQCHNIVEDTFIERAMGQKFPGAVHNIERLHDFFIDQITMPALKQARGDQNKEFGILVVPVCRAWSGQKRFQDFLTDNNYWKHPLVKAFTDKMGANADKFPNIKNSHEALEIARVMDAIMNPPKKPAPAPPEEDEGKEEQPGGESDDKDQGDENDEASSESRDGDPRPDDGSKEADADPDAGKAEKEPDVEAEENPASDPAAGDQTSDETPDDREENSDGDNAAPDEELEDQKDQAKGSDESEPNVEDETDEQESAAGNDDTDKPEGEEDPVDQSADEEADPDDSEGEIGGESEAEGGEEENAGEQSGTGEDEAGEEGNSQHHDEEPESAFENNPINPRSFDEALGGKIEEDMLESAGEVDYLIYTKDFDVIQPFEPLEEDQPAAHGVPGKPKYKDFWLDRLEDRTRHMVGPMQKDIERMMAAQNRVQHIPGLRRGKLNPSGLHRLMTNDDRIFRRREDTPAKNTAVSCLVDNSGSMDHGAGENRRIDIAMAAAYAMCGTLERVNIPVECMGFTTVFKRLANWGFDQGITEDDLERMSEEEKKLGRRYSRQCALLMPIFKGFEERLTPVVRKRFAAAPKQLELAANVDGECVMIAAERLAKRREQRKVLMVWSDGQPSGGGCSPWDAIAHLKKVVPEVMKMGIEIIGIGIQSDAVRHFYPKNIVLPNLEDLPRTVMGELKQILIAR